MILAAGRATARRNRTRLTVRLRQRIRDSPRLWRCRAPTSGLRCESPASFTPLGCASLRAPRLALRLPRRPSSCFGVCGVRSSKTVPGRPDRPATASRSDVAAHAADPLATLRVVAGPLRLRDLGGGDLAEAVGLEEGDDALGGGAGEGV